jgi:hypothetical protein
MLLGMPVPDRFLICCRQTSPVEWIVSCWSPGTPTPKVDVDLIVLEVDLETFEML